MGLFSRLVDKRLSSYQNDLIKIHYAEVENMYNHMRAWRHDYRNHIGVLKSYAGDGDLSAINRYLDGLDSDLSAVDKMIRTGNKMTDAILNSKISLANAKNITVISEARIPVALTTSEIDLCIIIGNLFDNAIEASLALSESERIIRIYMDMKGQQLYMSFTNRTASKKQQKLNGRFKTTKGSGHGFGLVRIDDIIARYKGYISRNSEDGAFTTEILLPQ